MIMISGGIGTLDHLRALQGTAMAGLVIARAPQRPGEEERCDVVGLTPRALADMRKLGEVRLNTSGKVLDGPAPRPLDLMPIQVSAGGEVQIIDMEFKAGPLSPRRRR